MMKKKQLLSALALGCALFVPSLALAATETAAKPAAAKTTATETPAAQTQLAVTPSCVLMTFTDDTRFKALDSSERLSELVMERLVSGNKFNLQANQPIAADMEDLLYNDRREEVAAAKRAIESGDLSAVFEGPAFHDETAQTISTAQKGQFLAPAVTAKIGKDAQADYLLQGTIVEIAHGTFEDVNFANAAAFSSLVLQQIPIFGGILANTLGNSQKMNSGFSVMADMRVVRASTGEVVWTDRVTEHAGKSQINYGFGHVGNTKNSENDYVKALEKVADHLVTDMETALGDKVMFNL